MNASVSFAPTGNKLIDDFLRRELRVGDPTSAREVADALRRRYVADAARLDDEAAGRLARAPAAVDLTFGQAAPTPASREADRVLRNLEVDGRALVDLPDNRDFAAEWRGLHELLLHEYAEAQEAAAGAADAALRERGFLGVRRLNDHSRVVRLASVAHLDAFRPLRRFAADLDDAAMVVRMRMGEALCDAGLADGGLIPACSLVDARQRRDALLLALRRLSGLEQDAEDWGDATASYAALLEALDARSAPELRAYLREDLLGRSLDDLIGRAARRDPVALRGLAATSPVEIARLARLLRVAALVAAASPALSQFVQSLKLFLEAFGLTQFDGIRARSGARLIDLALPLPLAAQQVHEADGEARARLRDLVGWRYDFALESEAFLEGGTFSHDELVTQVQLDKVLHEADRAIDLYAQGAGTPDAWGDEEQRAAALLHTVSELTPPPSANQPPRRELLMDLLSDSRLDRLRDVNLNESQFQPLLDQVTEEQARAEVEFRRLAQALAPRHARFGEE